MVYLEITREIMKRSTPKNAKVNLAQKIIGNATSTEFVFTSGIISKTIKTISLKITIKYPIYKLKPILPKETFLFSFIGLVHKKRHLKFLSIIQMG